MSLRVKDDVALDYFKNRFEEEKVWHEEIKERAGRKTLYFKDEEDQRLMLVSDQNNTGVPPGTPWKLSPVKEDYQILGLGPVRLTVKNAEKTINLLTGFMGYREIERYKAEVEGQEDIRVFEVGEGGSGSEIHVEPRNDLPMERQGYGGVHHVAFRVEDEEELQKWIEATKDAGMNNSGFVERFYFKSLYFREPNGILYELATDGPGFDTDEELEFLGETLSLPPFLEDKRDYIEKQLAPLDTRVNR